jgi:hypothetical protein
MLSNDELSRAFLVGLQVIAAGCAMCLVALLINILPLDTFWIWGLGCCVAGVAIAISSIIITLLNIWHEETKVEEPIQTVYKYKVTCFSCKYYHGLNGIHCALHPYGKKFEDCRDFEI